MTITPNFIEIYDDVLSQEQCKQIITEFELDKINQEAGQCGDGVVEIIKKSTDIVHNVDDGSVTSSIILSALNKPLEDYKKKYPEINQIYWWNISPKFHIQRYYPNEGYFYPHAEVTDISSAMRVLVWMFYLNDVNDGGTKFTNYNKIINATKGRLVLWTPYWTHTHHGIISSTQTKYIATGWYSFIT